MMRDSSNNKNETENALLPSMVPVSNTTTEHNTANTHAQTDKKTKPNLHTRDLLKGGGHKRRWQLSMNELPSSSTRNKNVMRFYKTLQTHLIVWHSLKYI